LGAKKYWGILSIGKLQFRIQVMKKCICLIMAALAAPYSLPSSW
jgi:hypothetical protein